MTSPALGDPPSESPGESLSRARLGALLLIGGGAAQALAAFLPWYTAGSVKLNGFDHYVTKDLSEINNPGRIWVTMGVILVGLGVATWFAGRRLVLAIIGVGVAAVTLFTSLLGIGAAQDTKDQSGVGRAGFGAYLGIISALIAFAGSIIILIRRRAR